MEGEVNVDKSRNGLYGTAKLSMVEEVAEARLELGVPVEDVELRLLEWLQGLSALLPKWCRGEKPAFVGEESPTCWNCIDILTFHMGSKRT